MGLHDWSSVLVAERQEVEEVSEVEKGVNVVLKRIMRHTCERHVQIVNPQQEAVGGQDSVVATRGFKVSAGKILGFEARPQPNLYTYLTPDPLPAPSF